jgi:hypothetical protein
MWVSSRPGFNRFRKSSKSAGSMRAARYGAFWPLAENFRPGRFPRRILIVAGRKSDNKKVSFDRGILFELFMIPLELRGMQETKEFDLDLVNKCSPRTSAANR